MTQPTRKRRRILHATLLTTVLTGAVYIAGAIHFMVTPPGIDRDYYAELNARFDPYPESQRAWRTYVEVANNWTEHASPLRVRIDRFLDERDAFDADGDRLPDPFTSDEAPFQIPTDHEFYPDLLELLDGFAPQLTRLRAASQLPVAGMPITDNWADNDDLHSIDPLPPTADLRDRPPLFGLIYRFGAYRTPLNLLAFESFVAADRASAQPIIDNTRAIIGIARHTHEELDLMGGMVALHYLSIADQTIARIIHRRPAFMTEPQLAELQILLTDAAATQARIDFTGEFMVHQELLDHTFTKDASGNGLISFDGFEFSLSRESGNAPPPVVLAAMWPIRHRFMDRAYHQSLFDQMTAAALAFQEGGPASYPHLMTATTRLEQGELTDKRVLWRYSLLLPAHAKAAVLPHLSRTRLQATAARLALERYRLAEGHYPDTLAELISTYLPELPQDPFNPGHPIHYLLRDGSPILYSVGSNGVDDQATPAPQDANPANLEARFADPSGPSPNAPNADWILYPPQE